MSHLQARQRHGWRIRIILEFGSGLGQWTASGGRACRSPQSGTGILCIRLIATGTKILSLSDLERT